MDALTIDLLCNHKKEIKKKDYNSSKKNNNYLSNINVSQVLSNNIDIFNSNISQYHNNDLDNILNIMLNTSTNIIQYKKMSNNPIHSNTIIKIKKLISIVKTSQQISSSSNFKQIKIKSKIRNKNNK